MNSKNIFILVFLFFCAFGCNRSKVDPQAGNFNLYLDYWNSEGVNPEIKFNSLKTDREIKIDFSKTFAGHTVGSTMTNVVIDNFRIVDENNNNFLIDKINAYEYRADSKAWRQDVEFTMNYTASSNITVTLVLDRSESLGNDFEKVKEYAIDFVNKVFQEQTDVSMGIVDFADNISNYPITKDKDAIINYIKGLKQGKFTTLYDAANLGIDMLQQAEGESKVLVVFTDGTDNNSSPNVNVSYLLNKTSGNNGDPVSIFTIGLEGKGGVDKTVLSNLASSGGKAAYPQNIGELKDVFIKFSSLISNVYHLTYIRNQQIVPRNSPIQLKFEIFTK